MTSPSSRFNIIYPSEFEPMEPGYVSTLPIGTQVRHKTELLSVTNVPRGTVVEPSESIGPQPDDTSVAVSWLIWDDEAKASSRVETWNQIDDLSLYSMQA
jgi:hypothetical protein